MPSLLKDVQLPEIMALQVRRNHRQTVFPALRDGRR